MILLNEIIKESVIYKITSPIGRIYIGQAQNLSIRYKSYLNLNCKGQRLLYGSFIKYGISNHTIEILEKCSLDIIDNLEIFYINFFKSNVNRFLDLNGLNLTDGGPSVRGYKQTDEHKNKISKANTGKKQTSEAIRNSSLGKIGNKNRLNKFHSKETKKNISNSKKGQGIGGTNPSAKKVIDTMTLEIYECAKDAINVSKYSSATIYRCLQHLIPNKTTLIYLDEYLLIKTENEK